MVDTLSPLPVSLVLSSINITSYKTKIANKEMSSITNNNTQGLQYDDTLPTQQGLLPSNTASYNTKTVNKEMSQINEFKLRRAHWEGKGGIACCLNIPKEFVGRMGLDKQLYLKVTYSENKLIVEKLVDGGQFDNK